MKNKYFTFVETEEMILSKPKRIKITRDGFIKIKFEDGMCLYFALYAKKNHEKIQMDRNSIKANLSGKTLCIELKPKALELYENADFEIENKTLKWQKITLQEIKMLR